jgi:hypothetical protein
MYATVSVEVGGEGCEYGKDGEEILAIGRSRDVTDVLVSATRRILA